MAIIISKAALQAVLLTAPDKDIPMMDCLMITPDGTVAATNGKIVLAVSPISEAMRANIPLPGDPEPIGALPVILPSATIKEILKNIPADKLFKGLLEHASLVREVDDEGIEKIHVHITDGKRTNIISVRGLRGKFPPWNDVIINSFARRIEGVETAGHRVILNRKRLSSLMETFDKICAYDGSFSPVYLEFVRNGDVIFRGLNELTGQRTLAVFMGSPVTESNWPELDPWERKTTRKKAIKKVS